MVDRLFVGVTNTLWGATPGGASLNWNANFTPDSTHGAVLNAASPSNVEIPGTGTPACSHLDCTGFTHTLIGGTLLRVYGNVVLSATMSLTDVDIVPKADASFTFAGKTIRQIQANDAGIDFTFLDTARLQSGLECDDGIVHFGANTCYLRYAAGDAQIYVADTTFSTGAVFDLQTDTARTIFVYPTLSTKHFPPVNIHGTGTASFEEYDWDVGGGPHKFASLTLTSGILLLNVVVDIETIGDLTLTAGAISGLAGRTLTVGGNFVSRIDLIGATEWFLDVTGSARVYGKTITNCTSTGRVTVFGGIDGGGNSANITFVSDVGVQTQDSRLNGISHLAVAVADNRLVASCASSCQLVTIDILSVDTLAVLGASAAMMSSPQALAADSTNVFVLSGFTLRSYTNAVIPVLTTSVSKNVDNNRLIALVGSAYVLYADGEEIVVAARSGLASVHRCVSGIGRAWSGVYDASSGYLFVFAELFADCAIIAVNASTGALTLTNIISLPNSAPIEEAVIHGTNLHFVTSSGARLQTWDITIPAEPVFTAQAIFADNELRGLAAIDDDIVFLSPAKPFPATNDEFDFTPYASPLYHSGRIFVPQPEPGRLWSNTRFTAWDTDSGALVEV